MGHFDIPETRWTHRVAFMVTDRGVMVSLYRACMCVVWPWRAPVDFTMNGRRTMFFAIWPRRV